MDAQITQMMNTLLQRYPELEQAEADIRAVYGQLEQCYLSGGKLLVAGNGGSAADAEHIVSELMKGFRLSRSLDQNQKARLLQTEETLGAVLAEQLQGALPAVAVTGHSALMTACMNDCDPRVCFAQQVYGLGQAGDVLLCVSTSGNSENILFAAVAARARGMKVLGLTGATENKLLGLCDACVRAPQTETYKIQELHLPIYHCLCSMLEHRFFGAANP